MDPGDASKKQEPQPTHQSSKRKIKRIVVKKKGNSLQQTADR